MLNLIVALIMIGVSAVVLWHALPGGKKRPSYIGTEYEPYVAVGIKFFFVLGVGFAVGGIIELYLAR